MIILSALISFLIIGGFSLGLILGNNLKNNKEIKMPELNPVKIYKEYKTEKIEQEKLDEKAKIMEINLENIENYDGTGLGQKDF